MQNRAQRSTAKMTKKDPQAIYAATHYTTANQASLRLPTETLEQHPQTFPRPSPCALLAAPSQSIQQQLLVIQHPETNGEEGTVNSLNAPTHSYNCSMEDIRTYDGYAD